MCHKYVVRNHVVTSSFINHCINMSILDMVCFTRDMHDIDLCSDKMGKIMYI
jgi:hypothetical protein